MSNSVGKRTVIVRACTTIKPIVIIIVIVDLCYSVYSVVTRRKQAIECHAIPGSTISVRLVTQQEHSTGERNIGYTISGITHYVDYYMFFIFIILSFQIWV